MNNEFGWVLDEEAITACCANANHVVCSAVADLPREVNLQSKMMLPVQNQLDYGFCVGMAATRGCEYLLIHTDGMMEPLAPELNYAGSRQMTSKRFNSDGSTGAWMVQFLSQYGVLTREKYCDQYDFTSFNGVLARKFASEGDVPICIDEVARQHPVRGYSQVKTIEEARTHLSMNRPILVCSSQGFTRLRSVDGVCEPEGTWMHAMLICGYRFINDKLYFIIENSWGEYMQGNAPSGCNNGSFLAEGSVVSGMFGFGDSWALYDLSAFALASAGWKI